MNLPPELNDELGAPGADAGMPDAPAAPSLPNKGQTGTVPIPLAALAEPEESSDQLINPEVGDICNFQVEGKIVSINGENAMVQPSSVNGKPLDGGADDQEEQDEVSPEQQDAGDYSDLESQANQLDQSQNQS